MHDPIPYKIQCKSTAAFFETIAAFDCETIARRYLDQCRWSNPSFQYRLKLNGRVL